MRILLIGKNGFIGKNLRNFLETKYSLSIPDRNELDLLKMDKVENYLKKNCFDVVINTANTNDFVYSVTAYDILDKNLKMFFNLERCSHLYGKMIYFGSGAEYDQKNYIPYMKEEFFDTFIPKDSYGFSKYIMAKTTEKSGNIYDLVLFGVYGKFEEWRRRFISNNLCRSLKGLPMTLNQNVIFDYLYIDDLCRITDWFIAHEPHYKRYNVCTGIGVDLLTLAKEINQVTELKREIQIYEPGWKREYTGNNERLLSEMGSFQFADRKKALNDMYKYYKGIESQIII